MTFQESDWQCDGDSNDECDDDVANPVAFWHKVMLQSIDDGLPCKTNPFKLKVSTKNWAPLFVLQTQADVINTEGI